MELSQIMKSNYFDVSKSYKFQISTLLCHTLGIAKEVRTQLTGPYIGFPFTKAVGFISNEHVKLGNKLVNLSKNSYKVSGAEPT